MKYIVPLYVPVDIENYSDFEKQLKTFIDARINKEYTFEIHDNKFDLYNRVYCRDLDRFCSTIIRYCHPDAVISGYDFDSKIKSYFIEVFTDTKFKATGIFCPRIIMDKETHKIDKIVGFDYIVKGGET